MSLGWPLAPSRGLGQAFHFLSREDANDEHLKNARSSVHCFEYERPFWNTCFLTTFQGKEANSSYTITQNNDVICLQETRWEGSISAGYSGTCSVTPALWCFCAEHGSAGGLAICIHKNLPDGAIVTLLVT